METAKALSPKHLNNQINEAKIILDALNGAKAWSNHPVVLQYKNHRRWLFSYMMCLIYYKDNQKWGAEQWSKEAEEYKPHWHTEEFLNQMKRRLYTKNPTLYSQWSNLGISNENWYFVDGVMRKYIDGKRIE